MTTFDKREQGFENKFAHDENTNFSIRARRNKLVGLWVAEKLGLSGLEAETYAKTMIVADLEEAGDGDVIRKIKTNFAAKSAAPSDAEIIKVLDEMMGRARLEHKM